MKLKSVSFCVLLFLVGFTLPSSGRSPADQESNTAERVVDKNNKNKKKQGPAKHMEQGGKDIGKGLGKGAKDLGEGTAGSVGNLATGHPVGAAASLGKGVGGLGKNVGVGTGKGVARIGKGLGGETKKLGRKIIKRDEKG